jgi:hypothetical protein
MNAVQSPSFTKNSRAKVVFPAPFGPAKISTRNVSAIPVSVHERCAGDLCFAQGRNLLPGLLIVSFMAKVKADWHAILPGGLSPSAFSLDELRSAKRAHAFLTEEVEGPEGIALYIRAFRYLLFFGVACVAEDKYPPLTRCWKELEALFMKDPAFDDAFFVQSWILLDFPFGPERQTALDYFSEFLKGMDVAPHFQRFVDAAKRSRLGLHQDVMRTQKCAKFRELICGTVSSVFPSLEEYGKGEILLARTMSYENQTFIFGNSKGFPKEAKRRIEEMVLNKLFFLEEDFGSAATLVEQYETFMKLAGPYWMSCSTKNEDIPILDPDHYRTY